MENSNLKNTEDLTEYLTNIFELLRKKEIGLSEAKIINSLAATIMKTNKTQMEYNKMTGSKKPIPFLTIEK